MYACQTLFDARACSVRSSASREKAQLTNIARLDLFASSNRLSRGLFEYPAYALARCVLVVGRVVRE